MSDKKSGQVLGGSTTDHEHLVNEMGSTLTSGRRGFVGALGAGGLGMLFAKAAGAVTNGPLNPTQRRDKAYSIRTARALTNRNAAPLTPQSTNGDEEQHANKIGNFTKALPHNSRGEVNIDAYNTFDYALRVGTDAAFEAITLGGVRKLANPQSGLAFEMDGGDCQSFRMAPPPKFTSREIAAEISENYWMALLRDVPFSQYATNPIAIDAAADLTLWGADSKVPKDASGVVTPDLLFRGLSAGDRVGPYTSQFLLLPCPFGATFIEQRTLQPVAGVNFMTDFTSFLSSQNGAGGLPPITFENALKYVRNGRGLGDWVHLDFSYQAYLQALLVLGSIGAQFDPGIPYVSAKKQAGVATFSILHVGALMAEVSSQALRAAWYQKWFSHRHLRPEAYAGAVHTRLYQSMTGDGSQDRFPVHADILSSVSSSTRLGKYLPAGNAVLPMAYPEGSPTHPAYPAGHPSVAGACITIMKAFYNESFVIPNPRQPSDDGLSLESYTGTPLTVGGELNKLANNVGLGRNIAGMHWRSDATGALLLGEAVAIQLLAEQRALFNEPFNGFTITKFDGSTVTI